MPTKKTTHALRIGAVVGTIHSPGALAAALKLKKGAVDFLEFRVDAFAAGAGEMERLKAGADRLRASRIVTVRDPREGGANALAASRRRTLFREFLPYASLIDVELRSAAALRDVLQEARQQHIGIILSHHDFRRTPSLERLRELAKRAGEAGCTVLKVATTARSPGDLSVLLRFLAEWKTGGGVKAGTPRLSVMGMGEYGKISRLTLGRAGSVLNYGYLDKLQVSGQWPAETLKTRLLELGAPAE